MRRFGKVLGAVALVGLGGFFAVGCSSHSGGGGGNGQQSTGTNTASQTPTSLNSTPGSTTTTTPRTTTTPTVTTPQPSPSPVCTTASPTDPVLAHALATLNATRAQYGAPPLTLNTCQSACALRHSEDLANCVGGNFANLGSSANGGSGCAHLDFRNGDRCGAMSENQGVQQGTDPKAAFDSVNQMMVAEGIPANGGQNHLTNIINTYATSVAIGIYQDPTGYVWITEDFIH